MSRQAKADPVLEAGRLSSGGLEACWPHSRYSDTACNSRAPGSVPHSGRILPGREPKNKTGSLLLGSSQSVVTVESPQ